jgi:hydrogenase nickel incorporation protein HypA/HybF
LKVSLFLEEVCFVPDLEVTDRIQIEVVNSGNDTMHELAVTEEILKIALSCAAKIKATHVADLRIVIGQLSSFVNDSIQFYWDIVSQGTICEGARLQFEHVPARLRCLDCELDYLLPDGQITCPHCSGKRARLTAGEELCLESITVEEEEFPKEAARS